MVTQTDEWMEMIDALRGTCDMISNYPDGAEELFEGDQEFCKLVDQHIFSCHVCGWWCDIDEESSDEFDLDEWTCLDCCQEGAEE